MSKCLVTGAAGFIGSHLCERLVADGHKVIGLDAMTDYYDNRQKDANLNRLRGPGFEVHYNDLGNPQEVHFDYWLKDVNYVFHLAAQPGVRASWDDFESYTRNNVLATQRLLAACVGRDIKRLVYASSSSVYGDAQGLPWIEETTPEPISPYGVTKLAGELLCRLYAREHGLPVICLRYFTVYGPRQRPDMAFHKWMRAIIDGEPIEVYGDGQQTRDFTYVDDVVDATVRGMRGGANGEVVNIGGGSWVTMADAAEILIAVAGRDTDIVFGDAQPGDARDTWANIAGAKISLNWGPRIALEDGLRAQWEWMNE